MRASTLLFITYCSAVSGPLFSQEPAPLPKRDSIDLLLSMASHMAKTDLKSAQAITMRAIAYSESEDYKTGLAAALSILGKLYYQQNKVQESLRSIERAAMLYEQIGDTLGLAKVYNQLASLYIYKFTNFSKASYYCKASIELNRTDTLTLSTAFTNIAALHLQAKEFDKAIKAYSDVYAINKKRNDLPNTSIALNNIATVLDLQKKHGQAITYYEKSLTIEKSLNNQRNISNVCLGIGLCYYNLKDYGKAEGYLKEAVLIAQQHGYHDLTASGLLNLSAGYQCQKDLDKAKIYAIKAREIINHNGLYYLNEYLYQRLLDVYSASDEKDSAALYDYKLKQFKDSIAIQERQALSELVFQSKEERKSAPESIASFKNYQWFLIAGGLGVLVFVYFIVINARKKNTIKDLTKAPENTAVEINNNTPAKVDKHLIKHLEIVNGEGLKVVSFEDILWFEKKEKNYVAVTLAGSYRIKQTITELEGILPKEAFFRINRGVIINFRYLNNYSFWENHKYIIRMDDQNKSQFVTSRERLKQLKEVIKQQ